MIYLAGPIDFVSEQDGKNWREIASGYLGDLAGMATFTPAHAFGGAALGDPDAVRDINMAALGRCEAVLAAVWPQTPSWGTPIEIWEAWHQNKAVVIWLGGESAEEKALPMYLRGIPWSASLPGAIDLLIRELGEKGFMEKDEDVKLDRCCDEPQVRIHEACTCPDETPCPQHPSTPAPAAPYEEWGAAHEPDHIPGTIKRFAVQECYDQVPDTEHWELLATNEAITAPVHPGDVGYDLRSQTPALLQRGKVVKVPIGDSHGPTKIALPGGYWGAIIGRSGHLERGVTVFRTPIDNGYRGPLYAFMFNASTKDLVIEAGDKVAQLVLYAMAVPPLIQRDMLPESERGEDGFGSTGR
jgi:dUTP pyrophosphatase